MLCFNKPIVIAPGKITSYKDNNRKFGPQVNGKLISCPIIQHNNDNAGIETGNPDKKYGVNGKIKAAGKQQLPYMNDQAISSSKTISFCRLTTWLKILKNTRKETPSRHHLRKRDIKNKYM